MLVHGLNILEVPPAYLYNIFKFWSRHVNCHPKKHIRLWERTQQDLTAICQWILKNTRIYVQKREKSTVTIVTDAQWKDGVARMGAFILDGHGNIDMWSKTIRTQKKIAFAEASAVVEAIKRWRSRIYGKAVDICCDNTVTLCAFAKGISGNIHVNEVAKKFCTLKKEVAFTANLIFIPSEANPADPLTRDYLFDDARMHAISTLVPGRVDYSLRPRLFGGSSLPIYCWGEGSGEGKER